MFYSQSSFRHILHSYRLCVRSPPTNQQLPFDEYVSIRKLLHLNMLEGLNACIFEIYYVGDLIFQCIYMVSRCAHAIL